MQNTQGSEFKDLILKLIAANKATDASLVSLKQTVAKLKTRKGA